ncbi:MAG TPA: hypothetical protein VGN88_09200 [Phycisphaerae bacterium]|jgi:hypothetical protein
MPLLKKILLLILLAIPACCPCGISTHTPLPSPITLEEQSRRLTAWSHAFPRLRATTVVLGVRMEYQDDKGQSHTQNAEGTLQIRQHFDAPPAGADVRLLGKAYGQVAMDAGRNARDWWFAIKVDPTKTAWMGDAAAPPNLASLGNSQSMGVLRADLVPEVLALTPLPAPASRDQSLMMLVNDDQGTNELFIVQATGGRPHITRQIIVDRSTGEVRQVRLFDDAGVLVVQSQLTDYAPVTYESAEDTPPPATPPAKFPKIVKVTYLTQHMNIMLQFDEVKVPASMPPAAFTTPNFATEGLKIIAVENP